MQLTSTIGARVTARIRAVGTEGDIPSPPTPTRKEHPRGNDTLGDRRRVTTKTFQISRHRQHGTKKHRTRGAETRLRTEHQVTAVHSRPKELGDAATAQRIFSRDGGEGRGREGRGSSATCARQPNSPNRTASTILWTKYLGFVRDNYRIGETAKGGFQTGCAKKKRVKKQWLCVQHIKQMYE